MLVSSFAFYFAFPASDYIVLDDSDRPMQTNVFRSFVHVANPCDILNEVPCVSPVVRLTVNTVEKATNLLFKPKASKVPNPYDEAVLLRPDGRASGSSTEEDGL